MNKCISLLLAFLLLLITARVDATSSIDRCTTHVACSNDWSISAEFLAWFASQEASSVWADAVTIGLNTSAFGVPDVNFNWDAGFRIGIGRHLEYDQWDTQLSWTWFRTTADESLSIPVGVGEIHPEFFAADLSNNIAQSATLHWSLLFNMFDWQLGRCCRMTKNISMRPYIGVKGGWINQSIQVQYNDLTIDSILTDEVGNETLKNNFWGVGPLGGIDTKWIFRTYSKQRFSLFGNFSTAALWGTWDCADVYKNSAGVEVDVNMKKLTLGGLMLRGFFGLGWDLNLTHSSLLKLRIGYEAQVWFNQLRLPTSQLIQLHGDLTLQGVTLDCRYDF